MEAKFMDSLFEKVSNSEKHSEIINGVEVIQNRTTPAHNIAVATISTALRNNISANKGNCIVFTENVALFVNELCGNNDYFLPDVMVVCDDKAIREDGVHAAPLFVAEITSESTRHNDFGYKKEVYRAMGVEEYWVVDIQRNLIEKYLLSKDYSPDCFMHPEAMKVSVYDFVFDVTTFIKQK